MIFVDKIDMFIFRCSYLKIRVSYRVNSKMGVPKFFKWLIDNYPEHKIVLPEMPKEVDRLYIDANGLFHPMCFDILKLNPKLNDIEKLEKKMFKRIMAYIEYLTITVNPKKSLFVSVDGVAPMAKMNQQRKRRFRSIDDARLRESIKKSHGHPADIPWSNTVITPGTKFMEDLMSYLQLKLSQLQKKIKIQVTLSPYNVPGEGEHKILNDIRNRHASGTDDEVCVIHGLDADLIFLTLSSQRKGIYLMREASQFGSSKDDNKDILEDDVSKDLNFVDIDTMTNLYIEQLETKITEKAELLEIETVDLASRKREILNDFIFICYFLGNDFLPHIPSIEIATGGLDMIIDIYAEQYTISGGKSIVQLTKDGDTIVNVTIGELVNNFAEKLAKSEIHYFRVELPEHVEHVKRRRCYASDKCEKELWDLEHMRRYKVEDPIKLGEGESINWKHRYYSHYFGVVSDQSQLVQNLCNSYAEGLIWVAQYYFVGCQDYQWQYPYTHAPFISDLAEYLKSHSIKEVIIKAKPPLPPCCQLLSVLPPSCTDLLPASYRWLVTDDRSPIIDLYPKEVMLDMINKEMYWMCVPMIPAVEAERVLEAVKDLPLTKEERSRNSFGKDVVYG